MATVDAELLLPDGTAYAGRVPLDEAGEPVVQMAVCGVCGFTWNDAMMTSLTPAPSGRCPNEYGHDYAEEVLGQ